METEQATMVNREQDDETGRFVAKYESDDFLDALREHNGAAPTADIAETVGAPQRSAHYHLDKLRDQGRVSSRKVGGALLWMLEDGE